MPDVVNLNRARKAKRKADKKATSAANRVKFGRTKAQKAQDSAESLRHSKTVDGAKLDPST